MKKLIKVLLICILMLFILSITTLAATEGYYTYTVSNGKATITQVNRNISGAVTVPSTLGGCPVTAIGDDAFDGCTYLANIKIPDSVTKIGKGVFSYCYKLANVEIGNGVTTIGEHAFDGCSNLTSVKTGKSVTTIGSYAFRLCVDLTSIEIPNSVTIIGDLAFWGCESLKSVNIPNSVATIGVEAFYGCDSLESITVSNNNLNYCSDNGILFSKNKKTLICYPAKKINTSYIIPNGVITISAGAFINCENLTGVVIPNSVKTIRDEAFGNCSGLTSVEIPDGVTEIGNGAFFSCSRLTSIVISDSVTKIGENTFYDCNNLTSVEIPDSVTEIGEFAFNRCESLTGVVIPDSVRTIGNYAFANCEGLTSVVIGDSVTTICDSAFDDCTNLKDVFYRGNSTKWNTINIESYNNDLLDANIIYNAIKIKAYDKNGALLEQKYVAAEQTTYKKLFPDKTGYTSVIYADNKLTKKIDANTYITEDIDVYVDYEIKKFTYEFVNWDGTVIKKKTADYQTVIEKPETVPTKKGNIKYSSYVFSNWSGYTQGMKLTQDVTFTAVYEGVYRQNIELTGATDVTVGEKFTGKILFATTEPVNYLVCEIVYPDVFELNSITAKDFKYVTKESDKEIDGYNYLTVICQYADDDGAVPQNTQVNPFDLSFTVSKTAKSQEVEIEFGEDTYLSGEEDYAFENKIAAKVEILPKLASSVTITGKSTVYEPTQFTAEVYPDYTTDKTVVWSVDDETVATISKDGILTPVKNGTVKITATAVGGSYKTKNVTVYRKAYVGFDSDIGVWDKNVLPDTKEYTIYVTEDTSVINITPLFTTGTLKYNDVIVMKNKEKEFELTEKETTITLARSDIGYQDCTYTIKVIKTANMKTDRFMENCANILVCNGSIKQLKSPYEIAEMTNSYKIFYWESLENLKPVYAPIIKEF